MHVRPRGVIQAQTNRRTYAAAQMVYSVNPGASHASFELTKRKRPLFKSERFM